MSLALGELLPPPGSIPHFYYHIDASDLRALSIGIQLTRHMNACVSDQRRLQTLFLQLAI